MRDRSDIQIALVDIFEVEGNLWEIPGYPGHDSLECASMAMTVTFFGKNQGAEPRYLNEERSV